MVFAWACRPARRGYDPSDTAYVCLVRARRLRFRNGRHRQAWLYVGYPGNALAILFHATERECQDFLSALPSSHYRDCQAHRSHPRAPGPLKLGAHRFAAEIPVWTPHSGRYLLDRPATRLRQTNRLPLEVIREISSYTDDLTKKKPAAHSCRPISEIYYRGPDNLYDAFSAPFLSRTRLTSKSMSSPVLRRWVPPQGCGLKVPIATNRRASL